MAERRTILSRQDLVNEADTAQAKLRAAIYDGIGESDVKEIVRAAVRRAKEGDKDATKLVMDYFLGGAMQPAKVEYHVHLEGATEVDIQRALNQGKIGRK